MKKIKDAYLTYIKDDLIINIQYDKLKPDIIHGLRQKMKKNDKNNEILFLYSCKSIYNVNFIRCHTMSTSKNEKVKQMILNFPLEYHILCTVNTLSDILTGKVCGFIKIKYIKKNSNFAIVNDRIINNDDLDKLFHGKWMKIKFYL